MATVTLRDETATGKVTGNLVLQDVPMAVTVRDLIRFRVREEVARHNASPTGQFVGLVRPTAAQAALNGSVGRTQTVDWERQADVAERAFLQNGFFILLADRQVEDLDELLTLDESSDVVFVRLIALIAG